MLIAYCHSDVAVNWLCIYITNVALLLEFYFSYLYTSEVFLVFPTDLSLMRSLIISRVPNTFFANSVNIRTANSITVCIHPQANIASIHSWCVADYMKLNIDKIRVIAFSTKIFTINNNYKVYDACINRTHFVKDMGVFWDSKMFSCVNLQT